MKPRDARAVSADSEFAQGPARFRLSGRVRDCRGASGIAYCWEVWEPSFETSVPGEKNMNV